MSKRVRAIAAVFAWLAAVSASPAAARAGASSTGVPIEITDDRGMAVRLAQPAQRVVSLLPSLTETVCALGACARLVATDRWSNWPAGVDRLPKAGGLDDANIELIVAHRPDLVLVGRSARVAERLEALGIRVAAFEARSLADIARVMRAVGALVGAADADSVARRVDSEIDAAARKLPSSAHALTVYFEIDTAPYAAGQSSFIGELLSRLGATNIVPASLGAFPRLNPEFVVRSDPHVVVVAKRHAGSLAMRPGWSSVRALQAGRGRVCAFETPQFEVLVRPGPRAPEAAQLLAGCLADAAAGIR